MSAPAMPCMEEFEIYLQQAVDSVMAGKPSRIRQAMAYSLLGGGKRVRPRLLFATLESYGMDPKAGFPAAAALEMIHTYSLIHDDLPAMDNDDLRRGKPTCHKAFDEASAILAGDGLLTQAFFQVLQGDLPAEIKVGLSQDLADYAGLGGMIYGQELDMAASDAQKDLNQLLEIELYKTGKLLTLPFLLAARIAGRQEERSAWKNIGRWLGYEFQIQDDILDVEKTAQELGKSNSDTENAKMTAVSLMGLDEAKAKAAFCHQEILKELEGIQADTASVEQELNWLLSRQK